MVLAELAVILFRSSRQRYDSDKERSVYHEQDCWCEIEQASKWNLLLVPTHRLGILCLCYQDGILSQFVVSHQFNDCQGATRV
jgi:hypothetical protein